MCCVRQLFLTNHCQPDLLTLSVKKGTSRSTTYTLFSASRYCFGQLQQNNTGGKHVGQKQNDSAGIMRLLSAHFWSSRTCEWRAKAFLPTASHSESDATDCAEGVRDILDSNSRLLTFGLLSWLHASLMSASPAAIPCFPHKRLKLSPIFSLPLKIRNTFCDAKAHTSWENGPCEVIQRLFETFG